MEEGKVGAGEVWPGARYEKAIRQKSEAEYKLRRVCQHVPSIGSFGKKASQKSEASI